MTSSFITPFTPYPPVQISDDSYYRDFHTIQQVMHLEDYKTCLRKKTLQSHTINGRFDTSRIPNVFWDQNFKVMWFAPSEDDNNEHSYYGNVAFSIKFDEVKEHFGTGFRMYYIEYVKYQKSFLARILITRKNLSKYHLQGELFDITKGNMEFMPLRIIWNRMKYVSRADSMNWKVEFIIDCEYGDENWFYRHCDKQAVSHHLANRKNEFGQYFPYSCHKHNNKNRGPKEMCPSPFTVGDSTVRMKAIEASLRGYSETSNTLNRAYPRYNIQETNFQDRTYDTQIDNNRYSSYSTRADYNVGYDYIRNTPLANRNNEEGSWFSGISSALERCHIL